MHIFFSVGEPSGDEHAAELIRELRRRRPDMRITGLGGPEMEAAGCKLLYLLTNLAVMGFVRVVPLLWRFYCVLKLAERHLNESRPDAVVLVDFPGFNWWIARKAKAAGVPVFYYLPPQLWAWAPWRIRRMRRFVDHVLCGLPFEADWYGQRGMKVEYVGHPFYDKVCERPLDLDFIAQRAGVTKRTAATSDSVARVAERSERIACERPFGDAPTSGNRSMEYSVALLPGSRGHEVAHNWPMMLNVLRRLHARHPNVRFLVANYKPAQREACIEACTDSDREMPIEFHVGKTSEIIAAADCALIVSGSVSLELMARGTPTIVLYRIGRLFYLLVRPLVICKFISLPNLIAGREVMPEFVSVWRRASDECRIAERLAGWLGDREVLDAARHELEQLRDGVMNRGATRRTADAILGRIESSQSASASPRAA